MNILRRDLTIEWIVEYNHYAKNDWKMICNAGIHEKNDDKGRKSNFEG